LNSQDYKPSQFTGGSADDAKPPLYGNHLSALNTKKTTEMRRNTVWIKSISPLYGLDEDISELETNVLSIWIKIMSVLLVFIKSSFLLCRFNHIIEI